MKNTINIFSETGCIPHEMLWKYRQGKLSTAEKHAVEVHLTDCELCSDALAGMMSMQSDEVIAGLRKNIRNISSPKKVIRFYDYRILSAAAAVAAVVFVFSYIINSSDKQEKKEIAQVIVPKQEPAKKEEQPPVASLSKEQPKKTKDSVVLQKAYGNSNNGAIVSNAIRTPALPQTQEGLFSAADNDKQAEPAAEKEKDVVMGDAATTKSESYGNAGDAAPTQTAARPARNEEEQSSTSAYKKDADKKKSNTSSIMYYNNLKVARTPAMSTPQNSDTILTGTPAMYESQEQKAAESPAHEMPFVYSKTLKEGMDYFHANQFRDASQTFSIILERLPNDVNSQFYKGLSEMNLQNYSESAVLLNKAMLNSNPAFYEEAKFKLALCYIALDQKEKAEKLLDEIVKEKGFYSEKAAEELQRLK